MNGFCIHNLETHKATILSERLVIRKLVSKSYVVRLQASLGALNAADQDETATASGGASYCMLARINM